MSLYHWANTLLLKVLIFLCQKICILPPIITKPDITFAHAYKCIQVFLATTQQQWRTAFLEKKKAKGELAPNGTTGNGKAPSY